jgi:hypothetical protein
MSKINYDTDLFLNELNKFCYGEEMVPLIAITGTTSGRIGLFCDSKFEHQQKADILLAALRTLGYAVDQELKAMKAAPLIDPSKIEKV